MTDLDRLLENDPGAIARQAADSAEPPDFDAVLRRGRSRRARRRAGALGGVALAVAVIVGLTQVIGAGDGRERPGPAEHTSPSVDTDGTKGTEESDGPSQERLARVVDADDAVPVDLAVTTDDPQAMASMWQWNDRFHVLALTTDGWRTRTLRAVPSGSTVTSLGEGRFVLREGPEDDAELRIVDDAEVGNPIVVSDRAQPVGPREIPVVTFAGNQEQLVAVSADGEGHTVDAPAGLHGLRASPSRLVGWSYEGATAYHWSDDGGATWQSHAFPGDPFLAETVWSAAGDSHALIEGADGATLFPFVALHTASDSDPSSWTRTEIDPGDGHIYVNGSWEQDGETHVLAEWWADARETSVETGVWRVVGNRLEKVGDDHPPALVRGGLGPLLIEYADAPVVWVQGDSGSAWRSADGGATWESVPIR